MTDGLSRRVVQRASAILVAGALAACGLHVAPDATTSGPPEGSPATPVAPGDASGPLRLLVLLGRPGSMRLLWLDGARQVAIPLPDGDVRWISGSASRGLVVTSGPDGRILAAGPFVVGERPDWREIRIDADARRWLGQPVAVAVADPSGDSIAAVAADPGSGFADGHVAILDPSGGPVRILLFPGRWDGRAPAWLGSGRVAISTRDERDSAGLAIVDLATAGARRWGTAIAAFAASGDGLTLAFQDRDDRRVLTGPVDGLLAGASPAPLPIDPRSRLAAQLLLDVTGRRLAIAWLDDAGDTTAYSMYERGAAGWALVRTGPLPGGTSRAVLVSLGP